MAKGLRASTKKNNKRKLRSRVFAPVEQARKSRLSAKLLSLSGQEYDRKTTNAISPKVESQCHSLIGQFDHLTELGIRYQ